MLKCEDKQAVAAVRHFLDEISFSYVRHRLLQGNDNIIFPSFHYLQDVAPAMSPLYGLVFALLTQGHGADDDVVRRMIPAPILDALVTVGLLACNEKDEWRTPNVVMVSVNGLYLAVSTPPFYPTSKDPKQPVYIGTDSLNLIKALPLTLHGRRALDICSGSGIQGMVCATRGASRVVCLERSPQAVMTSRFNIALNGLAERVEVRESDLFGALDPSERFEFVVSNPPFMPVMGDVAYPICGDGGEDGNRILRRIFHGLGHHLSEIAEGVLFCNALGGFAESNIAREISSDVASAYGLAVNFCISDKWPIDAYVRGSLAANLRVCCPELSLADGRQKAQDWLERLRRNEQPAQFLYEQIIRFRKGAAQHGVGNMPLYNPSIDPQLKALRVNNKRYVTGRGASYPRIALYPEA